MNESLPPVSTSVHELAKAAELRHEQAVHSEWYQEMQAEMEAFERSGFEDLSALHPSADSSRTETEVPTQPTSTEAKNMGSVEEGPGRLQRLRRLGYSLLKLAGRSQGNQEAESATLPGGHTESHGAEAVESAITKLESAESPDMLQALLDEPEAPWADPKFRRAASRKTARIVRDAVGEEGRPLNGVERAFRTKVIESYGFSREDAEDIWKAWTSFSFLNKDRRPDPEKIAELTEKLSGHFSSMALLERSMPGSVAALRQGYGIRHFNRYHPLDLLWQLRNPYVRGEVHLTATDDSTHAMDDIAETILIHGEGFEGELSKKRVFLEASTREEAHGLLGKVAEDRGLIRKLYVHAHGNTEEMVLSNRPEGYVEPENVEEFVPAEAMMRGSEIIMFGCESDKLAEAVAKRTGARVTGTKSAVSDMRKKIFRSSPGFRDGDKKVSATTYGPGRVQSAMYRVGRKSLADFRL